MNIQSIFFKNTVYLQMVVHVYNGTTTKTYEGTKSMSAITKEARRAWRFNAWK